MSCPGRRMGQRLRAYLHIIHPHIQPLAWAEPPSMRLLATKLSPSPRSEPSAWETLQDGGYRPKSQGSDTGRV